MTFSGGSASFAIAWLILVPLEAALSADRRMMVLATGLALLSLAGLHGATLLGLLPPRMTMPVDGQLLTFITYLGGIGYAGALVSSVQDIHRRAAREVEASRELYRLIAENANDLITRHDAFGRITFASLASRTLLGLDSGYLQKTGFQPLLPAADWDRHTRSLTRCLAVELGTRNPKVRVNCVLPGPVMLPPDLPEAERSEAINATLVKREGSPEHVAKAVLALVANDFITGVCLPVDGGRTVYAG